MIYGPIHSTMEEFGKQKTVDDQTRINLRDIIHSLVERSKSLVAKGAISQENFEAIKDSVLCEKHHGTTALEREISTVMERSYSLYKSDNIVGLGHVYGAMARKICEQESPEFLTL
jgi:hypothetical protein